MWRSRKAVQWEVGAGGHGKCLWQQNLGTGPRTSLKLSSDSFVQVTVILCFLACQLGRLVLILHSLRCKMKSSGNVEGKKLKFLYPQNNSQRSGWFCFAFGLTYSTLSAHPLSSPVSTVDPQESAALHQFSHFPVSLLVPLLVYQDLKLLSMLSFPTPGSPVCSLSHLPPGGPMALSEEASRKSWNKVNCKEGPNPRKKSGVDGKLQVGPTFGCVGCDAFALLRRHDSK